MTLNYTQPDREEWLTDTFICGRGVRANIVSTSGRRVVQSDLLLADADEIVTAHNYRLAQERLAKLRDNEPTCPWCDKKLAKRTGDWIGCEHCKRLISIYSENETITRWTVIKQHAAIG